MTSYTTAIKDILYLVGREQYGKVEKYLYIHTHILIHTQGMIKKKTPKKKYCPFLDDNSI